MFLQLLVNGLVTGSVIAIAGIFCSTAAAIRSVTRAAPSSMEYSVCTCRCTKESLATVVS